MTDANVVSISIYTRVCVCEERDVQFVLTARLCITISISNEYVIWERARGCRDGGRGGGANGWSRGPEIFTTAERVVMTYELQSTTPQLKTRTEKIVIKIRKKREEISGLQ